MDRTELEKQIAYYQDIAEKTGQRRLREVEQLNRLIAERKEKEAALRASEQRFRLIAQSTNDIFYEWDISSGKLKWLGDIDGALGYAQGEIEHTLNAWLGLIHPHDRKILDNAVSLHRASEKPIQYTYRVIRKDGAVRYWHDNGSPVLDSEGNPQQWVGGISDITEQKQAEEALIQAQRLSAIGELASGVAHDFNNSLQVIYGNTELALMENIPPAARRHLETIKQCAADTAARILKLQRFSGQGKDRDGYERIKIHQLLDTMLLQTRPLWKDESEKVGIAIAVEKKYADRKLTIFGNSGELRSVLFNLIKNSVQAMPRGGKLVLETEADRGFVGIIVRDTGKGMDEETKARVFQPFFTTKGFEQGKGLGLSISYGIIKEHGGTLHIRETAPGKGTAMEIRLPCAGREEKQPEPAAVPAYEGTARVLWVDDEAEIRDLGKNLLKKLNRSNSIDTAAGGEEALSLLEKNRYDLLITDVGMPNMSGWQLAEAIKGKYPGMKVALVTGWAAQVSDREKAACGVGYVLGKPLRLDQLEHLIGEVLQFKRL